MEDSKENICRLCMKVESNSLTVTNSTDLEENIKEKFETVLPELNLDEPFSGICSDCTDSKTLDKFYTVLKSFSENDSFLKEKKAELKIDDKVNLKVIAESISQQYAKHFADDKSICRTCLRVFEGSGTNISNEAVDASFNNILDSCLSNVDLALTADPVMCKSCLKILHNIYDFKKACLKANNRVKLFQESNSNEKLDLNTLNTEMPEDNDEFLSEFEVQDDINSDIVMGIPSLYEWQDAPKETIKVELKPSAGGSKKRISVDEQSNADSAKKPKFTDDPKTSCNTINEESEELPPFMFNFRSFFNPMPDDEMVGEWLEKVELLKRKHKWSDGIAINKVLLRLQNMSNLYSWFNNISDIMSWEEWKKKLTLAFPGRNDFCTAYRYMIRRIKKQNETYADYYNEKMKLLEGLNISGEEAVSCLLGGLKDEIIVTVGRVGNHKGPEHLLDYFKSCDEKETFAQGTAKKHSEVKPAHNKPPNAQQKVVKNSPAATPQNGLSRKPNNKPNPNKNTLRVRTRRHNNPNRPPQVFSQQTPTSLKPKAPPPAQNNPSSSASKSKVKKRGRCSYCYKFGHMVSECRAAKRSQVKNTVDSSLVWMNEDKCNNCYGFGHQSLNCPKFLWGYK